MGAGASTANPYGELDQNIFKEFEVLVESRNDNVVCDGLRNLSPKMQGRLGICKKSDDGSTLLHLAAAYGFTNTCKFLCQEHEADVNARDKFGATPLFAATANNNIQACGALINELGADVNAQDNFGATAIFVAAHFGKQQICELLIENKAQVNLLDQNNSSPLTCALASENENLAKMISQSMDFMKADSEKLSGESEPVSEDQAKRHNDEVFGRLVLSDFAEIASSLSGILSSPRAKQIDDSKKAEFGKEA